MHRNVHINVYKNMHRNVHANMKRGVERCGVGRCGVVWRGAVRCGAERCGAGRRWWPQVGFWWVPGGRERPERRRPRYHFSKKNLESSERQRNRITHIDKNVGVPHSLLFSNTYVRDCVAGMRIKCAGCAKMILG